MNKKSGFTVIEVCVLVVFLVVAGAIFVIQKGELQQQFNDKTRKTAINAMYYNLEEVFYKQNGYYPKNINEKTLTAMDPNLFTDPLGVVLGEEGSQYRYEPTDCDGEKCQSYALRADLDLEEDYIKKSKN